MIDERKQYAIAALLIYLAWLFAFQAVGRVAAHLPTHDFTIPLDQRIPLVPGFIWIYNLCYALPLLPVLALRDWHRFNRVVLALIIANLSAFILYLFLPGALPRPALGDSLAERLVAFGYAADFQPGANQLPSMHVAFAWLAFLSCRGQRLGRAGDALLFALAIGVTLSTLFIKQHVILDALSGVAWAFAAWAVAGSLYRRGLDPAATPRAMLNRVLLRFGAPALAATAALVLIVLGYSALGAGSENP